METLTVMGQHAKTAAAQLAKTGISERNNALKAAADALLAKRDTIQTANAKDIEAAKKNQMKPAGKSILPIILLIRASSIGVLKIW